MGIYVIGKVGETLVYLTVSQLSEEGKTREEQKTTPFEYGYNLILVRVEFMTFHNPNMGENSWKKSLQM